MADDNAAVILEHNQLQQLLDAIPVAQPAPKKRLTPFSSTDPTSWIAWKRTFNATSKLNGWNDGAAVDQLSAALEGEASNRTAGINLAANNPATNAAWTIREALEAIDDVFLPRGSSRLAQSLFDAAKQAEGESVLEWHSRLRNIFQRAYPNVDYRTSPEIRKKFVLNLRSPLLIKDVMTADPDTYDECLVVANDKASILYTLQSKGLLARSSTASADVAAIDGLDANPGRTGGLNANVECYYCHRLGHFKSECPSRPRRGGPRGGGRGRGRFGGRGRPFNNRSGGPVGVASGERGAAINALENALQSLQETVTSSERPASGN